MLLKPVSLPRLNRLINTKILNGYLGGAKALYCKLQIGLIFTVYALEEIAEQKDSRKKSLTIVRRDLGRDRVVFWGDVSCYRDYYFGVSNCGTCSKFNE